MMREKKVNTMRRIKALAIAIALSGGLSGTITGGALAASTAAPASAQHDTLKVGPKVGAKIPHMLKTVDQNGQHQEFKTLARKRGLLILFTRSVDW